MGTISGKRGISLIVSIVLLIILAVAGVSILFVATRGILDEASSNSAQECLTVNLKPTSCSYISQGCYNVNGGRQGLIFTKNLVFLRVEREHGDGDLKTAKIILKDINGNDKAYDVRDYSLTLAGTPVGSSTRDISNVKEFGRFWAANELVDDVPSKAKIAPVVGDDGFLCEPSKIEVNCGEFDPTQQLLVPCTSPD
jgi:hypothetical protein